MRIIAHRSGPTIYPEQTIASAKKALQDGAELIEVDVRFTLDHEIAICHDKDAKRVFGVDLQICEMNTAEFLALRHVKNCEYCSHLLEDYLKCGITALLIHVKQDEVIPELVKLLTKYDCLDEVVLGVESIEAVQACRTLVPIVKILAFMPRADMIQEFAEAGVDYIRLWEEAATWKNVTAVKNIGKELWIMTCTPGKSCVGITTRENLSELLKMNIDGILINDINELQECLKY